MADCTKKCVSRRHGSQLTSALTRRAVSDAALAAYLRTTCNNFTHAFDHEGRTALHTAASRGRRRLVEWLARHSSEAFVNARDRESGYTPLHRSIFYGQIHVAVALIKMGVNTELVDKDDYRALEHALLDRGDMRRGAADGEAGRDVYVWGSNSNYTLGTGAQQRRVPDALACFSRTNVSIKQVCLGKFHSVWVGSRGEVWACGQGGRLGAPHAGTLLRPTPLRLPAAELCLHAAVTVDSTVLLLQSGVVIQYSLNDNETSSPGVKSQSVIRLPAVKPLMKLAEPLGLCASRVHAVVWNKRAIYTWGHNVGQLGHSLPADKYIDAPKRVAVSVNSKEEAVIELGAASEAATVFNTSRGDVYLLHDHICKKIAIKQINLKQLCVESKACEGGAPSRVTVLLLTSLGQVLLWHSGATQLTRCTYGLVHQTVVTHMALTHDSMLFTTDRGEAYAGVASRRSAPASAPAQPARARERERDAGGGGGGGTLVRFLERHDCTPVRIRKIPNVQRAVSVAVDTEGLNFACLQVKPGCGVRSLPALSPPSLARDLRRLHDDASVDDLLHDVVFKVGSRLFPAHMFVVASGSELLYTMYQEHRLNQEPEKPTVALDNIHPEVFERILLYLYTGTCDVAELGPCGLKIKKEDLTYDGKKEKVAEETDLELIEGGASEISAWEVYKREGEKKRGGGRQRSRAGQPGGARGERVAHAFCDPVKLVQASAKRLQVMGLHKLLDKYYYREGDICMKESASAAPAPTLVWDRHSLPDLADTAVRSKDGVLVPAHRCILAARLDYFHGMFMHSWTESESKSTVTLPVNHSTLLPVVTFLYTDTCPEVSSADSIDFLCSLLVVADQLFVTRLREMCEVALADFLTLKNCAELCQFAHTYNSEQLKRCCMEFISLNVCTLLENRSLDFMDDDLLEDITSYHCQINKIMASRVITPFYNAPSEEEINECAKFNPIDLDQTDEELKRDVVEVSNKKKSKAKKIEYTESEKARMRYESVSSVNDLDLSTDNKSDITLALKKIPNEKEKAADEKQEKWVKIPTGQQKQQMVVQARLKAASAAKDLLNETPTETFTKLSKCWPPTSPIAVSPQSSLTPTTSRMSLSPKDSPLSESAWKSPQSPIFISHVGAKLSQKQRKKLALQGSDPSAPQNIDDYLMKRLSLTESPPRQAAPRNPWKVCEVPAVGTGSVPKTQVQFNQILADQQKQKENFSRIMTKSLALTQLEDKAIEDLERFYNADEMDEELITVRRIEILVSSPQWIHTVPK